MVVGFLEGNFRKWDRFKYVYVIFKKEYLNSGFFIGCYSLSIIEGKYFCWSINKYFGGLGCWDFIVFGDNRNGEFRI